MTAPVVIEIQNKFKRGERISDLEIRILLYEIDQQDKKLQQQAAELKTKKVEEMK